MSRGGGGGVDRIDERIPEWARSEVMAHTYSYLYNPLSWSRDVSQQSRGVIVLDSADDDEVGGATTFQSVARRQRRQQQKQDGHDLQTLMEPRLWRLVYGTPAHRDRSMSWADTVSSMTRRGSVTVGSATFAYSQRRMLTKDIERCNNAAEKIRQIQSIANLDNERRMALIALEKETQRRAREMKSVDFLCPPHTSLPGRRRLFEVQFHEAFLCSIHAVNNLANQVLLSPPDLLGGIELVRPLDSLYASTEELTLVLLREGVYTVPIRLSHVSTLNALDENQRWPLRNHCLEFIKEAGGMVILQPGHFVTLVHDADAAFGRTAAERNREWSIFSVDHITFESSSAADTIDQYICDILQRPSATFADDDFDDEYGGGDDDSNYVDDVIVERGGGGEDTTNREFGSQSRRQYQNNEEDDDEEDCRETRRARLSEASNQPAEALFVGLLPVSLRLLYDVANYNRLKESERLKLYILRTLVRRTLGDARVPESAGATDLTMPTPIDPAAFDAICEFMREHNVDVAAARGEDPRQVGFNGTERVNAASVVSARFLLDEHLQFYVDEIALALIKDDAAAALQTLVQTRSWLRMTTSLSLLFTVPGEHHRRLVSNRRWMRLFALHMTATPLIEALRRRSHIKTLNDDAWIRPRLLLFCFVAYAKLETSGIKLCATPHFARFFKHAVYDGDAFLRAALPFDDFPLENVDWATVEPKTIQNLYSRGSYTVSLWLLNSMRSGAPPPPSNDDDNGGSAVVDDNNEIPAELPIDLFATGDGSSFDDFTYACDRRATFVELLRTTLFELPWYDATLERLAKHVQPFDVQSPTQPRILEHYRRVFQLFDAHVERSLVLDMLDTLSFDVDALGRLPAVDDAERSEDENNAQRGGGEGVNFGVGALNNDYKPRFLERIFQGDISEIHIAIMGRVATQADNRASITDNIDRLPLPDVPGCWETTRPSVDRRMWLKTSPLWKLPVGGSRRNEQQPMQSYHYAMSANEHVRAAADNKRKRAYE